MFNRPLRPLKGSSYDSAGYGAGQIIHSLFDTGGPALNTEFGQDPMTAEGRPISKYGADEIYQQPTLAQRFFNPTAVERAQREQAAYRVQQIVSKQEADRTLSNNMALEKFRQDGNLNERLALDKQRIDAENARIADQKWALASQEQAMQDKQNATDSIRGEAFLYNNSEHVPQTFDVTNMARVGQLASMLMGKESETSGMSMFPGRLARMNADIAKSGREQIQEETSQNAWRNPNMAKLTSDNLEVASRLAGAQGRNTISGIEKYGDAMNAAELYAKQAEGMPLTGPGQYRHSLDPNLPSVRGRDTRKEMRINPLTGLTEAFEVDQEAKVLESRAAQAEAERKLKLRAAEKKAAAGSGGVTPAANSNPYTTELQNITQDADIAADRAKLSDAVQVLRNINAQIKAGGSNRYNYTEGDGEVFTPHTQADKIVMLKQLETAEQQRQMLLQKLQGRKPLSKQ